MPEAGSPEEASAAVIRNLDIGINGDYYCGACRDAQDEVGKLIDPKVLQFISRRAFVLYLFVLKLNFFHVTPCVCSRIPSF